MAVMVMWKARDYVAFFIFDYSFFRFQVTVYTEIEYTVRSVDDLHNTIGL